MTQSFYSPVSKRNAHIWIPKDAYQMLTVAVFLIVKTVNNPNSKSRVGKRLVLYIYPMEHHTTVTINKLQLLTITCMSLNK